MSSDPVTAVLELPPGERLRAVQAIWDSLAQDPSQVPITPAQLAEIDRRLKEYRENPDDVIPWEEVERELRSSD